MDYHFLSLLVMHFSQPPPLCQVHSHQSSLHYHSAMTVTKQAWHGHLPYKPNSHMMSLSDQLSSSIDSSLSHLQLQQVTMVSLFQPSWVYKQATLDPIHSVSPLLLPRQHLLLYKSSPHHCLLHLDVPCPDKKTLFLRFLSCLPSGCKSLRASPLALFLMLPAYLPRGRRS